MPLLFYRFLRSESGATAIEYALIAALISVAALAGMGDINSKLASTFDSVADAL